MKSKHLLLLMLLALFAPWAANAQSTLTVCDGTTTNNYVPVYGYNADTQGNQTEFIIPSTDLSAMVGKDITKMTFYLSGTGSKVWGGNFQVYMKEVENATFSTPYSMNGPTGASIVYEGGLNASQTTMDVEFTNYYNYQGGHLLIGFYLQAKGSYESRSFYGITANGASINKPSASGSISQKNFLPKTTFTYQTPATCPRPTLLEVADEDIEANAATIRWTASNEDQLYFDIYWSTTNTAPDVNTTPLAANQSGTSYEITGLTPATQYYVWIRGNCGTPQDPDISGGWTSAVSFATACDVIAALGYSENFDSYSPAANYTPSTRELPLCWNYINTCTYSSYMYYPSMSSYTPSSYAYSGSNYMKFYSVYSSYSSYDPQPQYAILPEMTGLAGKQVSMMVKGYNASSTFKVGTMSDPTDASTFVEITNSSNPSVSSTYQEFTYIIPANTTAKYLAIMIDAANSSNATNGAYIDDITITEAPTCFQPQSLAVTEGSLTAHEATLTWTPNVNGNETAWVLQIATKNDFTENLRTFDVSTTPSKALTELTDGTQYFARVKPDCDTEGTLWSNVINFTTPIACPAPTGLAVSSTTGSQTILNWTGNSDSYDVMYRTAAYVDGVYEEFDAGVPSGWTRYSGLVDAVIAGTATLSTVTSYWNTNTDALGTYNMALNIYGTSCKYWLVTPEFNLSQNLSFDLALTDFGNANPIEDNTVQADDRFVVLIYADEEWHILREWNNTGSEYVYNTISSTGENVAINLSAYQGKDVKIAFYGESTNPSTMQNTGGDNHLHIDNVHCGIPYEAGQWITHNQDPVIGTTYTLDGLSPETDYEVKVLSNCDGETSHETAAVSFTTEAACMVPNTVTYTNVTAHTAQLSWNSDASAWEICVNGDEANPVPANTNTNFELTGLIDGETYTAKVRAVCNGTPGDWSSEVSFTTPIACPAPTGLAVSGTTGSQTTLNWTGESDSYEVYYGEEESATVAAADFETGDFSQASFTNSTTYPWTVVENEGAHYAKSAGGFTSTQSDLTLQVVGPGTVQFRAKVSSESGYDYGRFLINGTQKVNVSGAGSWIDYEFELAAGNNTLVWRYYKDVSTDSNDDCFYVDDINITGMVVNTWNLHGTTDELTYTLDGLDPETDYQVKVKSACTNETGHETAAVSFTTEAACMVPNELAAVPATTTAGLSWTSDAQAWQISTGDDTNPISITSQDQDVTINGTTVSYTLRNLTPATTYTFKVRAVCDGTPSEWSETMSFTTECEAQTITAATPFTEGFEGITDTHVYSETNGIIPTCWDSYSEGSVYPHIINSGSYYYVHEGTGTMYFKGEASTNSYLALPIFTNDLSTLIVSFWMQTENASSGTLSLGYITDTDVNYNTYQVIKTYDNYSTSMIERQTYLGSNTIPSNATRLVFRWQYTGTSWYGACIDDVTVEIVPTFTKPIAGYGEGDGNWYLIASPLADAVSPEAVGMMITDDNTNSDNYTYDLYRFDQTQSDEWLNYRKTNFNLANGTGYLYANKNDVTLTFAGLPYSGNSKVVTLSNNPGDNTTTQLAGYNLVGNPFTVNAYIGDRDFYVMNNGTEIILANRAAEGEAEYIEPMEGIFVIATENNEQLTFTTTAPESKGASLALNVSKNRGVVDRAMVRFSESRTLPKFQLRSNSTKVYIPQDNNEYAVVFSEAMGELPVNFRAEENGSYMLSFTSEEVTFSYLHLIDNMTGADVDLLANPSYSFDALTTDYESRFKLVFATGNAADDNFAFYSNGNWIINNDGEATLQVIDVTGRILSSETVAGSVSKAIHAAPGVYMLRLVNGNNVKVQKVVVR